jgi:predicted ferric reductase
MPVALTLGCYLAWLWRRPIDSRLKMRRLGPVAVVAGGAVIVYAWLGLCPAAITRVYLFGELAGVLSVYLMSVTMILALRSPWLERWFGGLDRMYQWHRCCAWCAMVLLIPHVLVTGRTGPMLPLAQITQIDRLGARLGWLSLLALGGLFAISLPQISSIISIRYHRWLFAHRFIGVFLALGLLHGLLIDQVIARSTILYCMYLAIGSVGLACYGYAELLMRRQEPVGSYTVGAGTARRSDVLDLRLVPTGIVKPPRPGQFVFLRVSGKNELEEHPFSVAGVDRNGTVRLAIRALGDDTLTMYSTLEPGQPASLSRSYGQFDYRLGGSHQVWVAGGIGISPFLSMLGSIPADYDGRIDLYYCISSEEGAIFLSDLKEAAAAVSQVKIHVIVSSRDGRLTAERIVENGIADDSHVFICGPRSMINDIGRGLRQHGVSGDHLHSEHFDFR